MTGVVVAGASSLAVLSLLAFAVILVALCESAKGQGPECDRGQRRAQPSLRNFGDSKLAKICIICKPGPMRRVASVG
jgi:hypothetical protein